MNYTPGKYVMWCKSKPWVSVSESRTSTGPFKVRIRAEWLDALRLQAAALGPPEDSTEAQGHCTVVHASASVAYRRFTSLMRFTP